MREVHCNWFLRSRFRTSHHYTRAYVYTCASWLARVSNGKCHLYLIMNHYIEPKHTRWRSCDIGTWFEGHATVVAAAAAVVFAAAVVAAAAVVSVAVGAVAVAAVATTVFSRQYTSLFHLITQISDIAACIDQKHQIYPLLLIGTW